MAQPHCADPRDQIAYAESALFGLRRLLVELPPGVSIAASGIEPLVALIHEAMEPAVSALQDYVPRDMGKSDA